MLDYESSNDPSTAIFAFLAGALIGAGAAMLLAPRSGAETRQWITDYADKAKDQLDTAIESGKEYLQAGIDRGREYLESAQSRFKETGDNMGLPTEKAYNRGPQKG